jgi:hypothetical protein
VPSCGRPQRAAGRIGEGVPVPNPSDAVLSWERPFTPAMAARAGISRAALERMHRGGDIARVARGVYLDTRVPLTREVRARIAGLRVDGRQVVARRTAAWIHGAGRLAADTLVPVDVYGARSRWGPGPPPGADDVTEVVGVRCTTPVRTALDLSRYLAAERALPLVDGLLRAGALEHGDLLAAAAGPMTGSRQTRARVRELVARADGRAAGEHESVLRLRWLEANLPTPTPGLVVAGVRLSLAVRPQRFGAVLAGESAAAEVDVCERAGWQVVVVPGDLVLAADPVIVSEHLEREFHQHLLGQLA